MKQCTQFDNLTLPCCAVIDDTVMFIELASSVLHLNNPSGVNHTKSHATIVDSYGVTDIIHGASISDKSHAITFDDVHFEYSVITHDQFVPIILLLPFHVGFIKDCHDTFVQSVLRAFHACPV